MSTCTEMTIVRPALEWSKSVLYHGGFHFDTAVWRLLHPESGFEIDATVTGAPVVDLANEAFRQAVWDGVVKLLREAIALMT